MSRMIYSVTIAIVVGSIAASTIRANVLAPLAQFPPPIPGPCLSIPVYYDQDDDRLTFRKPESGPYTRPMVRLDGPGDAHVDAERDVLAIRPHAWTATQCLILAHHGEASGIRLARPEGQPTMPPPVFPDGPPRPRRRTERPDAGKRPGPLPRAVPGPGQSPD